MALAVLSIDLVAKMAKFEADMGNKKKQVFIYQSVANKILAIAKELLKK